MKCIFALADCRKIRSHPESFRGKIKELDYKTIRYPGHCEKFKLLIDLGFAEGDGVGLRVEFLQFPPPFGELEAFHTSGGLSTLPLEYQPGFSVEGLINEYRDMHN